MCFDTVLGSIKEWTKLLSMKLTTEEKAQRARQRMIAKAAEYQIGTYSAKFVAPLFQKMIRAEAAAEPDGITPAILDGCLGVVYRHVGQCVCVTCGKVNSWDSGIKGIHCGHFLASRRNSILLDEWNVAPTCSNCNYYRGGAPQEFRLWMTKTRGVSEIERLERLKRTSRTFTREELVDLRIGYQNRLDAAIEKMKQ